MAAVTQVYKNVKGLRSAIKDVGRGRQIATVLAKHGFGAAVTRLQLTEVFGLRNLMQYGDDEEKTYSFARRIRLAIEELGPTFVKLGQILSTRADLVGEEITGELETLQDDVPAMPWEDVEDQIQAHLGRPIDELFERFEREPLGRASVAQAHQARLAHGIDVVVKVRRRGISDTIKSDLSILHFLAARAEEFIPELRLINPMGIVKEFDRALSKELDFNNERNAIERFAKNFILFEGVHIPRTYPDYCAEGVLTMEFIDGVKVTDAPEKLGADPYALAQTMLGALFKMVFRDGFFHGDLHPGNILIRPDHTIGLIDFGLVGRLLPRQREDILDLLGGLAREDGEAIARVLFDLGSKVPGVQYNYPAFEDEVIELLEIHLAGKSIGEIDVQAVFGELVTGAIRHQIKMPPTYTMVFKSLMTVEGIGKSMAPDLDFIAEAKPFVKEMMLDRYAPERILREGADTITSASKFLRRFSQTAPRLLREMEQGNFVVRVEAQSLQDLIGEQKRASRRMMRAVLTGAGLLAAALAFDAPGPALLGVNAGAFAALVLSAVAGLPLLRDLIWPS